MPEDKISTGGHRPRAPEDHELTGTGTPRSADNGLPQPGAQADVPGDPDVVSGMTSTSDPASADDVTINRSGSGGTGGPVEADRSVEGSTGQTLNELLGDEEVEERDRR